jgi:magnesium transporter
LYALYLVITGLWGTNVKVPGQGVDSLEYFFGLATVMLLVGCGGYWWATRFFQPRRRRKDEE